jgi:ATP-dependent Clp protease adaptor protein ClpS
MSETKQAARTADKTRTKPRPDKTKPQQLPPYRVLLHNDDVNEMDYVVQSIIELVHLNEHDAELRMLEAHETGVALLLVTHKERAELLMEQFASKRLTVTIEPA